MIGLIISFRSARRLGMWVDIEAHPQTVQKRLQTNLDNRAVIIYPSSCEAWDLQMNKYEHDRVRHPPWLLADGKLASGVNMLNKT